MSTRLRLAIIGGLILGCGRTASHRGVDASAGGAATTVALTAGTVSSTDGSPLTGGNGGGLSSMGGASPTGGTVSTGRELTTGGVPAGGTSGPASATGGSSTGAGASPACSLPRAYCPEGSDVWPACTQRGGACVLVSTTSPGCPDGSYNPFSEDTYCPTGSIGRCCVPLGNLGSPCDDSHPCKDGGCLPEAAEYPAGGVCSKVCMWEGDDCLAGSTCLSVPWSQAPGMCLFPCTDNIDCRQGQSCQAFATNLGGSEIRYACWTPRRPTDSGLGEACERDGDCLSKLCRPDPAGAKRCTARCGSTQRCLPRHTCTPDSTCSSPMCPGFCFPG